MDWRRYSGRYAYMQSVWRQILFRKRSLCYCNNLLCSINHLQYRSSGAGWPDGILRSVLPDNLPNRCCLRNYMSENTAAFTQKGYLSCRRKGNAWKHSFSPSIIAAESITSAMTRFILCSKLPVKLWQLFVIFLERTIISLLIVCPLAHLIF